MQILTGCRPGLAQSLFHSLRKWTINTSPMSYGNPDRLEENPLTDLKADPTAGSSWRGSWHPVSGQRSLTFQWEKVAIALTSRWEIVFITTISGLKKGRLSMVNGGFFWNILSFKCRHFIGATAPLVANDVIAWNRIFCKFFLCILL